MPDVEATRRLTEAVDRLTDGRDDIRGALDGVRSATEELTRQIAADREEYERRIDAASARTEEVAEAAAPRVEVAAQTRGTRRRLLAVALVMLVGLVAVAATVTVLVLRARDQAATSDQFSQLAEERRANCVVSQTRTQVQTELVTAQLAADRASLALMIADGRSEELASFGHVVFDGRISAAERYLREYPTTPITCTVPGR